VTILAASRMRVPNDRWEVRAANLLDGTPQTVAWQQLLLMLGLLCIVGLLAELGLGMPARLFYIATGLIVARFFIRRSPWQFMTLSLWFWTLTPLCRRLINYHAGFNPTDFVLATPNLLTLFMLRDVLCSRDLWRLRESQLGLLLLMPCLYGLISSFIRGELFAGAAGAADWLAPILYYFYILANRRRIGEMEVILTPFIAINLLVLVAYGLCQYFLPSAWDVAWVVASKMDSIGQPYPMKLRIFSTVSAPQPLAFWLGTLILLSTHFRSRLTPFLVPPALLVLFMTLVRSEFLALGVGMLVAVALGRGGAVRSLSVLAALAVLLGAVISVASPQTFDVISDRVATLGELGSDESTLQREALYRAAPALIDDNPIGFGLGGVGRGATASANESLVYVDSGPVAIYLSLGWVGGSVYLAGIGLVLIQCLLAARQSHSGAAVALSSASISLASNILSVNMLDLGGAAIWICCAYASASVIEARFAGRSP